MFSVMLCGMVMQKGTFTQLSDYGTITQFTSATLSVNIQFYISWSSRRDISYSKIIPTRFNTFGISQKKNKGCLIFNRNLVFVVSARVVERKFRKMAIGKRPLCTLASLAFLCKFHCVVFTCNKYAPTGPVQCVIVMQGTWAMLKIYS